MFRILHVFALQTTYLNILGFSPGLVVETLVHLFGNIHVPVGQENLLVGYTSATLSVSCQRGYCSV